MSVQINTEDEATTEEDKKFTIEEEPNCHQDIPNLRSAYRKFAESTSFPGVGLISKTQNPIRRILWIIFLIFGTSMAVYQSFDLISGYRNYQVLTILTEIQNRTVLFPSITFCPPLPVLWNKIYPNHTVYKKFENYLLENTNISKWENLSVDLKGNYSKSALHELRKLVFELEEKERNQIIPQLEDVFLAVFNSTDFNMHKYFIATYIPAFGQCFTFNPGLPGYDQIESNVLESIDFIIHLDPKKVPPFVGDNKVLINLHQVATAPELHTGRIFKMRTGQEAYIPVRVKTFHRLGAPYPSKCIRETLKLTNLSLYSSESRPYEYERRACKEKFAYDQVLEEYNCSDPFLPPQSRNVSVAGCIFFEHVSCKVSCNSKVYDWLPIVTTYLYKNEDLEDLENYLKTSELFIPNKTFVPDQMKNDLIFLKFKMKSTVFDSYREQPRYSFSDILGAIGGNIGIWIGFSIVSLMEVFDFIVRILMKLLNTIFCRHCRKRKKPS